MRLVPFNVKEKLKKQLSKKTNAKLYLAKIEKLWHYRLSSITTISLSQIGSRKERWQEEKEGLNRFSPRNLRQKKANLRLYSPNKFITIRDKWSECITDLSFIVVLLQVWHRCRYHDER
jgi:hypothetical protein